MDEHKKAIGAIGVGVVSSLFLSGTFVINSLLSLSGGHWAWTATLRSILLIPLLGLVLLCGGKFTPLLQAIRKEPAIFLRWGILGFGILYTALAMASLYAPAWLIAATFQINILAGMLLSPFIYRDERAKIPKKTFLLSSLICLGVVLIQFEKIDSLGSVHSTIFAFLLVLMGAFAWPLGNRKLLVDLEEKGIHLNAIQRVLGMTIGSLPLLLLLGCIGYRSAGLPSLGQIESSAWSALLSGFLGGVGFYQATQMVKRNSVALATVEATQVFEIFFALIGEFLLTGIRLPGGWGLLGLVIISLGMLVHCNTTLRYSKTFALSSSQS
jgi:drug/metabolite transporter (DMT)-like permease